MTARLGIELSPSACRIVEVDRRAGGRARESRVRSFAVLRPDGEELGRRLAALRGRTAAVVVWKVPAEHRQVVVSGASYEAMRAEALASLSTAGVCTKGVAADIAPIVAAPRRGMRLPVVVALAPAPELAAALAPLRAAGIRLGTVMTPAAALASLARERRRFAVPGAIEAYIALEPSATCIALFRNGTLVAARMLPWGYRDQNAETRPRDEVAGELAFRVTEFVAAVGGGRRDLGQVCVSGGLAELRSMTLPLMERLDVEVEPLDSLFSIDAATLPEPPNDFRERVAELRLAWAAAAHGDATINLLRLQTRRESRMLLARAAAAAGILAVLAAGWRVGQSQWWRSRATDSQSPNVARNAVAPPKTAPRSDGGATLPAAIAPNRAAAAAPSPRALPSQPAGPTPLSLAANRAPAAPLGVSAPGGADAIGRGAGPSTRSASNTSSHRSSARPRDGAASQTPLPFDAVLGGILYSADRKLAIVDGRIVGVGDQIRDARVLDITLSAVTLRDGQGRMRLLTLGVRAW